ncbi:cytochrome P450 [Nannocystaceae bacterium ST9]
MPRRPPGPRGLPLIGSLPAFARDPLGFLEHTSRVHGDLTYVELGDGGVFFPAHPDDIEAVLVGAYKHCIKDEITRVLEYVLGRGLLTNEGESWKTQRKLAAPLFTRRHIAGYADAMVDHADRCCASLVERGGSDDLHHEFASLTLEIVVDTLFGSGTRDHALIAEQLEVMMASFQTYAQTWQRILPRWLPTPNKRRLDRAVERLDEALFRIIAERRAHDRAAPDRVGDDLLARLLAAREADESGHASATGMSDRQLRDEALTMIVAGHETTALTLTYALRELGRRGELLGLARAEVDRVLADRPARADDFEALPFLSALVDEALRLYPPAWAIGREAIEPFELRGYTIGVGDAVIMSAWVVHRDPRWWPKPTSFEPRRWLEPAPERPRFAFFPFGGGPRICIGNHFAKLEAVLILATMVQKLEFTIGEPPLGLDLQPAVTLRPIQPLPLRVRQRASSSRIAASSFAASSDVS